MWETLLFGFQFQAGQYSSHPPPTFCLPSKISSWAKEMGAGDWAAQRAEHPAGGEAQTPPHEVAKVSSGTGGSPRWAYHESGGRRRQSSPQPGCNFPGLQGLGSVEARGPSETPPGPGAICEGEQGTPPFRSLYFRILPLFQR